MKESVLSQLSPPWKCADPLECFRDRNYLVTSWRRKLAEKQGGVG